MTKEQEQKVKEHFENPKNNISLEKYNARGIGRNPDNWGQVDMKLLIDENEILVDLGYEYRGCPTIAFSASVFTEELKGVTLKEALYTANIELKEMESKDNCDDCIKMILVAFICANDNYYERLKGTNKEDFNFQMINTTVPYSPQACN